MVREEEVLDEADAANKGPRRPNPIDAHVGSRVRLRRMLLGMSQEKLAEKLGLTFQQVQKYEKGINRIGASRLFDLSQVLGVSVQFFYDEAPSMGGEHEAVAGFADQLDGELHHRLPEQPGGCGSQPGLRAHRRRQGSPRDHRSCPLACHGGQFSVAEFRLFCGIGRN